ncbi:MAG: aminotransferase class V-fold PLP-dependent enzyme [Planctomycetes bacterium]|nr:aminotransferase class V-fold PLP-dependent enzyme [Planctomycetota bacterium]
MADHLTEDDPLLAFRDRFPITQRSNYLINNSLGAMPQASRASVAQFLDEWSTRGVRAWGDRWWTLQEKVGDQVAQALGVAAGTVSMHQNVAVALEMILSCFRFDGKRNGVVYADRNFPSDQYIYEARARHGARLTRVPAAADGISTDPEQVAAAIDDSTLLVAIDHVMFRSSAIVDVAPIVQKARKVGAFVVLDTFHSVGTLPLDLAGLGVHAAVGGALKWLCGGPGNCFLYVDPNEARTLQPAFTGWAAHKQPFLFSPEGQDYRDDGGRFATGTPNVPALCSGKEGIATVLEAGLPAIRERSQRLTQLLIAEADRHGLGVKSPRDPERRAGHVALDVPHGYAVCQALSAREIVVDFRPDAGLRVAPHFYNTAQEVVAAAQAIRDILDHGEHQPFLRQERKPG